MILKTQENNIMAKPSRQIRISTEAYEKLSSLGRGSFTKKIDDLLGVNRKNPVPVRKPVYRDRNLSPNPPYFHIAVMSYFKTENDVGPRWEIMAHVKKLMLSKGIDKQYPEFFEDMDSYKSAFENKVDNQLKARVKNGDLEKSPVTKDDIKDGFTESMYTISQDTNWYEYTRPELEALLDKFHTFKDKSMMTDINFTHLLMISFYRNKFGKDWEEVYIRNRKKEVFTEE